MGMSWKIMEKNKKVTEWDTICKSCTILYKSSTKSHKYYTVVCF